MMYKYRFAFLISLFFHACAFALLSTGFVLSGQVSAPTLIDIVWNDRTNGQSDIQSPARVSSQRKTMRKKNSETSSSTKQDSPLADTNSAPASTQATDSLGSEGADHGHGGISSGAEDFRLALRTAIEQKKEYPALARARHQQGQVLVGFTLTKEGHIIDIHLVKPTVYEQLNQAALATIQRVGFFKPVPDEISPGDWNVSVPINFKLN